MRCYGLTWTSKIWCHHHFATGEHYYPGTVCWPTEHREMLVFTDCCCCGGCCCTSRRRRCSTYQSRAGLASDSWKANGGALAVWIYVASRRPPAAATTLPWFSYDGPQRTAGYDHGGYISPFVKAFLEYLLFSAGDTFAIVVAFFRAAARLSTFVGRPWSPRCCDNLRTCEVRGINHISPFFDWGLGFSHVRLANATYYLVLVWWTVAGERPS
jgi:hypothetical protein